MKITLTHVNKSVKIEGNQGELKEVKILNDISTEFIGEKINVIIGPSGSGKTTLLRMINRLDSPDSGQILLDGKDISEINPRALRKMVGMVFQSPALFRGTIFQNISFGPELHKTEFSTERAKQLLEEVGLSDLNLQQNVENLSLGQQQRISFARTLANEPKILLLDEPTSALDPTSANNLLDLILKINRKFGIGILMVTHIMHHAQRIADEVFLLVDGRMVESGRADDFFASPKTKLAQQFIIGELQ